MKDEQLEKISRQLDDIKREISCLDHFFSRYITIVILFLILWVLTKTGVTLIEYTKFYMEHHNCTKTEKVEK